MASVEGAVPVKTQEPNEYWEHVKSKDRVYFIGRTPEGEMVWQCEGDSVEVGNLDWTGWQHLPGCTGWEWEPEEFPQYYVGTSWVDNTAYVVRFDYTQSKGVAKSGTEFRYAWDDAAKRFVERGSLVRVTEAEAMARLDKPAAGCADIQNGPIEISNDQADKLLAILDKPVPVAPEMDWVVQDRVPARNNIDEWCWCRIGRSPERFNSGFGGWSSTIMHGNVDGNQVLHLRCRRKDLPPVPATVEETFPQWYILKNDENRSWVPDWTVKRTGEETSIRYARDEAGEIYATNEPWTGAPDCWERCCCAEAIERLGTETLPAVPSEPRRVPVKLWVMYQLNDEGGDWPVRVTMADQTRQNWNEIKFDGNGAFIEVES